MKSSYLELNLMYCSTGLKAELSPELIWYKIAKGFVDISQILPSRTKEEC